MRSRTPRAARALPLCLAALSACAVAPDDAPDPGRADPVTVSERGRVIRVTPMTVYNVAIASIGNTTFETRNCSPGADPVLHVFDRTLELGFDDNGAGGVNARVRIVNLASTYTVLAHARTDAAAGQCDLYRDGAFVTRLTVGGVQLTLSNVAAREAVELARHPGGADGPLTLLRLSGLSAQAFVRGTAAEGASYPVPAASASATFVVASNVLAGEARVFVNDAALADADGDGLGDALEAWAGTCSTRTGTAQGYPCSRVANPRDTDGDGLTDAWELRGRRDVSPAQPLQAWGADPRHKDLFVEVDRAPPAAGAAATVPSPATLRTAAARWQDTVAQLSLADAAAHAALLDNPDGMPGVSVHFDTGMTAAAGDVTLHGDWGGATALPAGTDYKTAWQMALTPARRGMFHWALAVEGGGGQTSGFPLTFGAGDGASLAHELGHSVGLEHWGSGASPVNCVPNYPSAMNYLYSSTQPFSDGLDLAPMNNVALVESGALAASPRRDRIAARLESALDLFVDRATWSVDWNRDGLIAPAGAAVRAYANAAPHVDCEGTTTLRARVTNASSLRSPAAARLGGATYVFYSVLGATKYNRADTGFGCTGPAQTSCGTFGPVRAGPDLDTQQGVELVDVSAGSLQYALLAGVGGDGVLRAARMWRTSTSENFEAPRDVATGVVGEPALTNDGSSTAFAAWRGTDGYLHQARYSVAAGWTAPSRAVTDAGAAIAIVADSAPGLGRGLIPSVSTVTSTYGLFHTARNVLKLYRFDPITLRWSDTGMVEGTHQVRARPSLAWVASSATDTSGGQLHVTYRGENGSLYLMRSFVRTTRNADGSLSRAARLGLVAPFNNAWMTVYGADLLFDRGVDVNLRAFVTHADAWDTQVVFYPLADGIVDRSYGDHDDWSFVRSHLCASVANPGNTVASPVACP
ncbi:MAG: hypothetical protein U0324_17895 [Polyangiales bacterium]